MQDWLYNKEMWVPKKWPAVWSYVNCQNTGNVTTTSKEVEEEVEDEVFEEGEDDEYDMEVVNNNDDEGDEDFIPEDKWMNMTMK